MEKDSLEQLVEAALFFKGGAVSVAELAKATGASAEDIGIALDGLQRSLEGKGIRLVCEGKMAALATAPEAKDLVERMRKEELEGPLGKAGLEALAVIIFRGPLTKSDIDYIRGVNSSSILRSLMIRGLIERIENPEDKRSFLYLPTPDLPAYLGVSSLNALPGYAETRSEIERVFAEREKAPAEEAEHHE
jgi:segregation and condensation protein B